MNVDEKVVRNKLFEEAKRIFLELAKLHDENLQITADVCPYKQSVQFTVKEYFKESRVS